MARPLLLGSLVQRPSKSLIAFAVVLCGMIGAWLSACSLNPQPIPPGDDAMDATVAATPGGGRQAADAGEVADDGGLDAGTDGGDAGTDGGDAGTDGGDAGDGG